MQFDRKITITVGATRKATIWKPETLLLSEFWARLGNAHRSTETLTQYRELPKSKQDELKDVGGFVAGTFKAEKRRACDVTGRDIITLDLAQGDNLTSLKNAITTATKPTKNRFTIYILYHTIDLAK